MTNSLRVSERCIQSERLALSSAERLIPIAEIRSAPAIKIIIDNTIHLIFLRMITFSQSWSPYLCFLSPRPLLSPFEL